MKNSNSSVKNNQTNSIDRIAKIIPLTLEQLNAVTGGFEAGCSDCEDVL